MRGGGWRGSLAQPTSSLPITSKEVGAGDPRRQPTLPRSLAKRARDWGGPQTGPPSGQPCPTVPRAARPGPGTRRRSARRRPSGTGAQARGRLRAARPGGGCRESAFDLAGPATARRVRGGRTRPAAAACSTCTLPAGLSPQVVGSPRARGRTTPHTATGGETLGAESGKGTPYLGKVGCGLAQRTSVRGAGSPQSFWGGESRSGRAS